MKSSVNTALVKGFALSAGLLGFTLRGVLYATGMDEKGLLVAGHWAGLSLVALSALFALMSLLLSRCLQGSGQYRYSYPGSVMGSLGAFAAAAGVLLTTLAQLRAPDHQLYSVIVGFAAALSLVIIALCRAAGSRPVCLFHGIVCVFFALRMVRCYQNWSSDPQLMDFVFYLSAYIALMLTAYHHAAFDAGLGNHKNLWLMSLLAVYLCIMSFRGTGDELLLLTGAFWALTNTTSLKLPPRRRGTAAPREV